MGIYRRPRLWRLSIPIVLLGLLVVVVFWSIYRGATVQQVGVPGFSITFGPTRVKRPELTQAQKKERDYHLDAARWARQHHRVDEADNAYTKALDIDPDNTTIRKEVDSLHAVMGETKR